MRQSFNMKQQIKCPHCKKIFPIEDSLKHEAEEYRKKLQIEEKEKSAIRQKEAELNFEIKTKKQEKEHQAQYARNSGRRCKKIKKRKKS